MQTFKHSKKKCIKKMLILFVTCFSTLMCPSQIPGISSWILVHQYLGSGSELIWACYLCFNSNTSLYSFLTLWYTVTFLNIVSCETKLCFISSTFHIQRQTCLLHTYTQISCIPPVQKPPIFCFSFHHFWGRDTMVQVGAWVAMSNVIRGEGGYGSCPDWCSKIPVEHSDIWSISSKCAVWYQRTTAGRHLVLPRGSTVITLQAKFGPQSRVWHLWFICCLKFPLNKVTTCFLYNFLAWN